MPTWLPGQPLSGPECHFCSLTSLLNTGQRPSIFNMQSKKTEQPRKHGPNRVTESARTPTQGGKEAWLLPLQVRRTCTASPSDAQAEQTLSQSGDQLQKAQFQKDTEYEIKESRFSRTANPLLLGQPGPLLQPCPEKEAGNPSSGPTLPPGPALPTCTESNPRVAEGLGTPGQKSLCNSNPRRTEGLLPGASSGKVVATISG